MTDTYSVDLEKISLSKFRGILERGDLLPSRKILLENLAERFALLEAKGIKNLKNLVGVLSTPQKIACFSEETGIHVEYLEILKRQTKIYTPNPQPLKEIPGLDPEVIRSLDGAGIRQTKQLFERAKSKDGRAALVEETNLSADVLLELVKLSDLARAGWVGPIFARLIYETGVDTVEKLAQSNPAALYEKLLAVNRAQNLTKGNFVEKDIASCIEIAQELTFGLEV